MLKYIMSFELRKLRSSPTPQKVERSRYSQAEFIIRCRPKLAALEAIRLVNFTAFKRRKKIAIPVAVVLISPFVFMFNILIVGLSAAGLWYWVTSPKRDYAQAYKSKILPEIAELFGNFTYDMKGEIPMNAMTPSGIVPRHTRYKSEDHFSGLYKGVSIDVSEIKLTKQAGKSRVTVFNGLAVLLSGEIKPFNGHTIITKDKTKIGEWAQSKITGLKRANLVDLEFERLFDVFTTDQTEARYLIDPVIMENLKTLQSEYNGDSLTASFYDDHVLILIGSKTNHFEPAKIDTVATNETELLAMQSEFGQILSIVDRLPLITAKNKRLYREV